MNLRANIGQLKTPQDVARLSSILSEISDELDVLYTETSPNGSISARIGRVAMYKNGSSYETWQNTDGGTTWKRIDSGAYTSPFQTGDWIVSSVNTARSGWTNKSATYADKMLRVNATPKATGGSDTLSGNTASTTLTAAQSGLPAHIHTAQYGDNLGGGDTNDTGVVSAATKTGSGYANTESVSAANAAEGHVHALTSVACVSAYITVCIFQKDA